MKKIIFSLSVILLSVYFIISCSKDEESEKIQSTEESNLIKVKENINLHKLSDNQNFINLVNEMNSFSNQISAIVKRNNLSINTVNSELNDLNSRNLDFDSQLDEINKIFKEDVTILYLNHHKIFNENWKKINELNINLTQEVLQDEFYIVMNGTNRSGWRYGLCIAAAAAGAVLCHAGCDTTALATTAGLGIPACVWACGTLQVMASVQCYDSYGG